VQYACSFGHDRKKIVVSDLLRHRTTRGDMTVKATFTKACSTFGSVNLVPGFLAVRPPVAGQGLIHAGGDKIIVGKQDHVDRGTNSRSFIFSITGLNGCDVTVEVSMTAHPTDVLADSCLSRESRLGRTSPASATDPSTPSRAA
jgi:hypothetical protein